MDGKVVCFEKRYLNLIDYNVFVFGLWYVNRYYQIGFQLEFAYMVVIIPILWALILFGGWWKDRIHRIGHGV